MQILADTERVDRITAVVHHLLGGGSPEPIPCTDDPPDEIRQLSEKVNSLVQVVEKGNDFVMKLSNGDLEVRAPGDNFFVSAFMQMQSSLRHLTWQTRQVAQGDFNQRVDFMGDFSTSFNTMVDALREARSQLENEITNAENLANLKSRYLNIMAHDITAGYR